MKRPDNPVEQLNIKGQSTVPKNLFNDQSIILTQRNGLAIIKIITKMKDKESGVDGISLKTQTI